MIDRKFKLGLYSGLKSRLSSQNPELEKWANQILISIKFVYTFARAEMNKEKAIMNTYF